MSFEKRKLRLTRIGLHFAFVAVFAMVGGSLRGFNLLLVLAGFLISALIVGWRCTRGAMEQLQVYRSIPPDVFAGQPFQLGYRISNHGRNVIWMLQIADRLQVKGDATGKEFACAIGSVEPRRSELATVDALVLRRGRYELQSMDLSTSFPLGLVRASKQVEQVDEVWVYAEPLSLRVGWQDLLGRTIVGQPATARRGNAGDGEFFGIRKWQSGDSPRWIHWRTTARTGQLAVRQFEQRLSSDVCLMVDTFVGHGRSVDPDSFELLVRLATTMVSRISASGSQVSLVIVCDDPKCIWDSGGSLATQKMLRTLAELAPGSRCGLEETIKRLSDLNRLNRRSTNWVALSCRTGQDVIHDAASQECETHEGIFNLLNGGDLNWLCVEDSKVRRWIDCNDHIPANTGD